MSTDNAETLRARVTKLQADVDWYRSQPDGRSAVAYGPLLGQLVQAQDALMRLQDPELAAFLDARGYSPLSA